MSSQTVSTSHAKVEDLVHLSESLLQSIVNEEWDTAFEYMRKRDDCLQLLAKHWPKNIPDNTRRRLVELDKQIITGAQTASEKLKALTLALPKRRRGHQHYLSCQDT